MAKVALGVLPLDERRLFASSSGIVLLESSLHMEGFDVITDEATTVHDH